MLIYNSKKEFIGIDEKDLKSLGFNKLIDLQNEVSDFADLFVKTPGYIHNFKHVHWLDFITCADSSEDSQAIINVNSKNFKCKISVENLFLTDNASSKAYVVFLNNLRELNKNESESISEDIVARPAPIFTPASVATEVVDDFDIPEKEEVEISPALVTEDPYETPLEVDFDVEDDDLNLDREESVEVEVEDNYVNEDFDDMLDVGDLSLDEDEAIFEAPSEEKSQFVSESFDNGYTYDPKVASDELGLPLDLIEEFIQDFIAQAQEFKDDIYTALNDAEFDKVKILSHKLKGVAANLRVEDAFEALDIVNTSSESNVIREQLDTFYKIIAKLSGEEVLVEKEIVAPVEEESTLDIKEEPQESEEPALTLDDDEEDDLYGDLLDVADSEVPQKIDIAELADDEFLSTDVDVDSMEEEIEKIEDIELLELDKNIEIASEDAVQEEMTLDFAEEKVLEKEEPVIVEEIIYSKENVANEIGLDLESFNELFEDYIGESGILLMQMRDALDAGDYKTCKHEALKLQGMSDNMRVNQFSKEFNTLANSVDNEELSAAINSLETSISQLSRIGA